MISSNDYKTVSDDIANDYNDNYIVREELFDAIYDLQVIYNPSSPDQLPKIFINELSNVAYNFIVDQRIESATDYLSAVLALQQHVTNNFGDVNLFLSSNGIKVKTSFAILSARTGFTISPGNIE